MSEVREKIFCNDCGKSFSSKGYMKLHILNSKRCQKHKDVLYLCRKCGFKGMNHKTILEHIGDCDIIYENKDPIEILEDSVKLLEENGRDVDREEIRNLKMKLQIADIKLRIYQDIIENNLPIKLDDTIREKVEVMERTAKVEVYRSYSNGRLDVVLNRDFETVDTCDDKGTVEDMISKLPLAIHKELEDKPIHTEENIFRDPGIIIESGHVSSQSNISMSESESESESGLSFRSTDFMKKDTEEEVDLSISDTDPVSPTPAKMTPKRRKRIQYRTIKNCSQEDAKDMKVHIETITDKFHTLHPKIEQEELQRDIAALKKGKVTLKVLTEIRTKRCNSLIYLGINEYIELLKNHCTQINTLDPSILENKKTRNTFISTLEQRLLQCNGYTDTYLDAEDVSQFGKILSERLPSTGEFCPLDLENFYRRVMNPSVAFFTVKDILNTELQNIYGCNQIVYVDLPKSSKEDPYSFYILEKLEGDIRYWKMGCRMEDIATDLAENLVQYCIKKFTKIYRDVFGDNDYRENWESENQVTEYDCGSLVRNIITLSNCFKTCKIMQELVKEHPAFVPTSNDKFNLVGDDAIQRKRFVTMRKNNYMEQIKENLGQLFDKVTDQEIIKIYDKHQEEFA